MLWTSDEGQNELNSIIKIIENEMVGLQVIATSSWHIPVFKQKVIYKLSGQRRMTILEEFVMKAALLDIPEGVSVSLISNLLALDPLFVETCLADLTAKNVIQNGLHPIVKLTNLGKQYFEKGMVPDNSTTEEIEYFFDRKFGMFYTKIKQDDSYEMYENYELMDRLIENMKKYVNKEFIVNVGKEQGKVIEHPELGKSISSLVSAQTLGKSKTLMSEIWVYDIVDDKVFCRIWDHAKGIFRTDIAEFIEKSDFDNKFCVNKKNAPLGIINDIKMFMSETRITSKNNIADDKYISDKIRIYRGAEIKPIFEKSLEVPKEQMIIFSPWITENVVDAQMINSFKKLASKNVQILIGWGINNDISIEKNPLSIKLIRELLAIRNDKGVPMVCLLYLGNKHEKEIVIDNYIHIAGSFNWLSYRGDYHPRGESIYYIQDKIIVENQREYWENEFVSAINTDIFETDNSLQLIAELNFLFSHTTPDIFGEMFKSLTLKLINKESPKFIHNMAAFCVANSQYIFESELVIERLLNANEFIDNTKKILAYVKFQQPQDYKSFCTKNYKILRQTYGQKYDNLKFADCKSISFV